LSPARDGNPPTSSTSPAPVDRAALMRHAHKIARDFRPFMPNYRAALAYALKTVWADAKMRRELKQAYGHIVRRPLTAKQLSDSRYATRRCGASYMPF
jgi:hypothetical protein